MSLTPKEPFALGHTNVSQPSLIQHKPSQQSITASEDYYSLASSSSTYSGEAAQALAARSTNTIHRYQTPPSRYRTPLQSRDYLPQVQGQGRDAEVEKGSLENEVRKTPMHGQGKRRSDSIERGEASTAAIAGAPVTAGLRLSGVRRKPVPSTVMEAPSPQSDAHISPTRGQSSVARDIGREESPPTPGVDDTPFIRFALDQLTRDEEVRGSRRYRGLGSGVDGNYPYVAAGPTPSLAQQEAQRRDARRSREDGQGFEGAVPAAAGLAATAALPHEQEPLHQKEIFEEPPPRNPKRINTGLYSGESPPESQYQQRLPPEQDIFMPISNQGRHHAPLTFVPGILRPLQLGIFLFLVLAYLVCLLFCAIWSLLHTGLWDYGVLGDARYFVFEYLPTILGMLLFFWLVQIEVAVYRIAPFVALSSESPRAREHGAHLPMSPKGFILPFVGHFKAGLPLVGVFMLVAWLQIWTIPLLASSFNVYFYGSPADGRWRWIATQGAIWAVIIIYLLLVMAIVLLMVWLRFGKKLTGVKWDPRSLADLIVLLERSNALDDTVNGEPAQLSYWHTAGRPNEVFHSFGVADKAARRYSLEDGRIREKTPVLPPPVSRFSADPTDERPAEQRHSREKMLPRPGDDEEGEGSAASFLRSSKAMPWFLRPEMAALWCIIAIVLLLAFLIVSYLPSTRVSRGFTPDVPAPVNKLGFSATNFLYSFVPAVLGMWCLLFWLDIDYTHRRLQAFEALAAADGELAERSLLLSYTADLPGLVTASAAVNKHWRVALLSFVSLLAAALPILAGGVFWAQFYIPKQRIRISADMSGYYALTVFATLYALAYFLAFPSRRLRRATHSLGSNPAMSFTDIIELVHQARMLDDVAFHAPETKAVLVTRLLSAPPGSRISAHGGEEAVQSKVSLADSVRGFGNARQRALGGLGVMEVSRYRLGRYGGRDGRDWVGVDRMT